jgi:hypothetical protein
MDYTTLLDDIHLNKIKVEVEIDPSREEKYIAYVNEPDQLAMINMLHREQKYKEYVCLKTDGYPRERQVYYLYEDGTCVVSGDDGKELYRASSVFIGLLGQMKEEKYVFSIMPNCERPELQSILEVFSVMAKENNLLHNEFVCGSEKILMMIVSKIVEYMELDNVVYMYDENYKGTKIIGYKILENTDGYLYEYSSSDSSVDELSDVPDVLSVKSLDSHSPCENGDSNEKLSTENM